MIDDYRILEVLHEGYASILCRAERECTAETVLIRLFTPRAGIDDTLAIRLKQELEPDFLLSGQVVVIAIGIVNTVNIEEIDLNLLPVVLRELGGPCLDHNVFLSTLFADMDVTHEEPVTYYSAGRRNAGHLIRVEHQALPKKQGYANG